MVTSRRTLIFFIVIAATFLIAHTINAVIAEALFVPAGSLPVRSASDSDRRAALSPTALADQVRLSGLFPLPAPAMDLSGGSMGVAGAPVLHPLNLSSRLRLLGVAVGVHKGVSAIVEELSTRQQAFYRLHDQIPGAGEVSEIREDGIVVRQGDMEELLELFTGESKKPPVSRVASAGPIPPATLSRKVVDRREVNQAMNDIPKLLSQARAVPYLVNGAMSGFRLDYIAPSSFYEKIGLRYGDILKQVNGVEIKDPSTMLALFQQLRNEQTVKLDFVRNNQPTTMTFEIR